MRKWWPLSLERWEVAARKSASQVIEQYSTSFTLASRLFSPRIRGDIATLYAVVRIADEIVDGAASTAGEGIAQLLDTYETQVRNAHRHYFHTDPVLQAFSEMARRCEIQDAHLQAFFESMRQDIHPREHNGDSLDNYIYGSAEVIGLMCVAIFYADIEKPQDFAVIESGARALGSGFQKINFLRDVGADSQLGRAYLPHINDEQKDLFIAGIYQDFAQAREVVPRLPKGCRSAVAAALALYEELTSLIDALPAAALATTRVSVPAHRKAWLTAHAAFGARKKD